MDCQYYITVPAERKKGQHLQREERGTIQHLKGQGLSNRAIAKEISCSSSTVGMSLLVAHRLERVTRYEDKFSQVFKTITVDNSSEFVDFRTVEHWGTGVYFAPPYISWECPQNERHNGLFRAFVPKGMSIESFSPEYILAAADKLNGRLRRKLGYRTLEELFDAFLDRLYTT